MKTYHAELIRRSDATEDMPFNAVTLIIRAESEDEAEMIADAAAVRLVGLGQMDIDSLWETA